MFTVALLMPFYFYNKATIVIYLCGKYNYVVYQGIIVTYLVGTTMWFIKEL